MTDANRADGVLVLVKHSSKSHLIVYICKIRHKIKSQNILPNLQKILILGNKYTIVEVLKMKLIERDFYLEKLKKVVGTPDIKIITGVRRSGKSKLLEAFKSYIQNNISNANVMHINFNLEKFESLKDYHKLNAYIGESYIEGKQNFVLIDEVQLCPNFELTINSLHAQEKYDIYLTGSNAFLLSLVISQPSRYRNLRKTSKFQVI